MELPDSAATPRPSVLRRFLLQHKPDVSPGDYTYDGQYRNGVDCWKRTVVLPTGIYVAVLHLDPQGRTFAFDHSGHSTVPARFAARFA